MRMSDKTPRRKATNVSLDVKLVEEARALGINVSRACEQGLLSETKAAREAVFQKEFAPAAAAWEEYHRKYGLPFAELRRS